MIVTRHDWLLVAALTLVVWLAALPVLSYPLGRDQGEFATIGRGVLDGRIPYTELWNPKPPAIFYVYAGAMALFGRTTAALRALDLLLIPAMIVPLYALGLRLSGSRRAGALAGLLWATFYFTESFWTLTQNDGIAAAPMTLAMACAFAAHDAHGTPRGIALALIAGALCGWAFWFKYPFALFGLALVAGYAWQVRPGGWRAHLGEALGFGLGGAAVIFGGLALLAAQGALDALVESARVTSQYTALTFNADDLRALMAVALEYRWLQWGPLLLIAAGGLLLWRVGPARPLRIPLLLWAAAALVIMLVQAKGYDYHWLPLLPPLALIAAEGIDRLLDAAARRGLTRRSQIPATALIVLILAAVLLGGPWRTAWAYLTGAEDRITYYNRFQGGEVNAGESLAVANLLRERVAPGDSLYIWGFRPEVYYLSGLNPATRFIFQFPLVGEWYPEAWREENVEVLWAALPPYVLVLQVDYMPWVTGRDADSNTLLQEYNDLNDWLVYNYERELRIGNFFLWRRKM